MRPILILFFLATSLVAGAQVRLKLSYNKYWELTTPDSAKYVRICIYDTARATFAGPVTDLFLNGKPQMTGTYRFGKKEGEFIFYYDNGNVESKGSFENDQRTGTWKYYYPNGILKMDGEFAPVLGEDQLVTFLNDSTGKPLIRNGNGTYIETFEVYRDKPFTITGDFVDGNRDGKWTVTLSNGKRFLEEVYDHGRFVRGNIIENAGVKVSTFGGAQIVALLLPYKVFITEQFRAAKNVDFKTYPKLKRLSVDGKILLNGPPPVEKPKYVAPIQSDTINGEIFTIVEENTGPPDGFGMMYKQVSSIMHYPPDARRAGIQGKVFVEFVVEKDGSITNITVAKGIGGGCDQEALRVVEEYAMTHKWNPGMQNGKPVRQRYVFPITFKLG